MYFYKSKYLGITSTNRRHQNEALDETNTMVPSDSTDDTLIESNRLSELEPSRTLMSNSVSFGSKLGMGFLNSERARRENSSHIYIYC
jgi:hypothetical protein